MYQPPSRAEGIRPRISYLESNAMRITSPFSPSLFFVSVRVHHRKKAWTLFVLVRTYSCGCATRWTPRTGGLSHLSASCQSFGFYPDSGIIWDIQPVSHPVGEIFELRFVWRNLDSTLLPPNFVTLISGYKSYLFPSRRERGGWRYNFFDKEFLW